MAADVKRGQADRFGPELYDKRPVGAAQKKDQGCVTSRVHGGSDHRAIKFRKKAKPCGVFANVAGEQIVESLFGQIEVVPLEM
jgi:hypothetical protein